MKLDDISMLILKVLSKGDFYGLEIIENIKKDTDGAVLVTQPVLYSKLRELESQKYVLSFWQTNDDGIKMHYYFLTPLGSEFLSNNDENIEDTTDDKSFVSMLSDDEDNFLDDNSADENIQDELNDFFEEKKQKKEKQKEETSKTITNLTKRKEKQKIEQELQAEEIQAFLENAQGIKSLSPSAKQETKEEKTKYLLVTKMNLTTQTVLLGLNVLEIIVFLVTFLAVGMLGLEQYIMLGCILLFSSMFCLIRLVDYIKNKTKKIHFKIKWNKNLIIRCVVFALLCIFAVAVVLICGAQNLFDQTQIFRWLCPCVYFLNIIFKWIILRILATKDKYITE